MNTPLMELIEWIQNEEKIFPFSQRVDPEYLITKKATELLEKERNVIENSYSDGMINSPDYTFIKNVQSPRDYYTKTFTNENK